MSQAAPVAPLPLSPRGQRSPRPWLPWRIHFERQELAADETAHLAFHRWFFTLQAPRGWRRALFLAAWFSLAPAAALVVLLDHRRTLRTLGIPTRQMTARLWSLIVEGAR